MKNEISTRREGDDIMKNDDNELLYDPNTLLDTVRDNLGLKNDAALARALDVAPPVISKVRHLTLTIGASLLIRLHEISGISIRDLRYLMGDKRK